MQTLQLPKPPTSWTVEPDLTRRQIGVLIALWMLAIVIGLGISINHDVRPGAASAPRRSWPAATALQRCDQGTTRVMFAHPECPCTAASLEQLAELNRATKTQPGETYVVFTGVDEGASGGNIELARDIPGLKLHFDADGSETHRFGSKTSGDLFVFDAQGKLLFNGGVTASRGHVGDNLAAQAAREAATGNRGVSTQSPVFGCALESASDSVQ